MSDKKKISIIVLGNETSLKKALITEIIGKDLSQPLKTDDQNERYENDTHVVTCTPDFCTASEDIKKLFANQHPDMSCLVVKDSLSIAEVWQQIEKLQEITGKATEEFKVVLSLKSKDTESFNFKIYTEQGFSELSKQADGQQMATNTSQADNPESEMSTPDTPMEVTGGRFSKERFTDPKKSLKRKHSGTTVNLVLLGLTGAGKSASGNTILRKKRFESRVSSKPVTTECKEAETEIGGTHVRVIDTPDIFDDEIDSSVRKRHVTKCRQLCQSGPCVYLLVMHVSRFTDGERDILTKLQKAFGSQVHEQTVILFVRGDDLKRDDISLEDFLRSCQPDLKKVVEKCDNRCVVFENSDSESHQVEELMETVNKVLEEQQKQ